MKKIQLIDCEGFKLWCILYFVWNMEFCKNKGFETQESFAHNCEYRVASISTMILIKSCIF